MHKYTAFDFQRIKPIGGPLGLAVKPDEKKL